MWCLQDTPIVLWWCTSPCLSIDQARSQSMQIPEAFLAIHSFFPWSLRVVIPVSLRASNRSSKVDILLWCLGHLGGYFNTRLTLISVYVVQPRTKIIMDTRLTLRIHTKHCVCSLQRPWDQHIFRGIGHTQQDVFTGFDKQVIVTQLACLFYEVITVKKVR